MRVPAEIKSYQNKMDRLRLRMMKEWKSKSKSIKIDGIDRFHFIRKKVNPRTSPKCRIYLSCATSMAPMLIEKLLLHSHEDIISIAVPATLVDVMNINNGMPYQSNLGRQCILETPRSTIADVCRHLSLFWKDKRSVLPNAPLIFKTNQCIGADPIKSADVSKLFNSYMQLPPQLLIQMHLNDLVPLDKQVSARGNTFVCFNYKTSKLLFVKIGLRGHNSDYKGFDALDRVKNEYKMLVKASTLGFAPKPVFYTGNKQYALLCTEYIAGENYNDLPFHKQVELFPKMMQVILKCRQNNIVHRDVKPSNFIVSDQDLYLIDWEIGCSRKSKNVIPGGTIGYIPPEGSIRCRDDLYALAASLAGILLQKEMHLIPVKRSASAIRTLISDKYDVEAAQWIYRLMCRRDKAVNDNLKQLQVLISNVLTPMP